MYAGYDRDRIVENIGKIKAAHEYLPAASQDKYRAALLKMDSSKRACTILTQDMTLPLFAYTPQHKEHYNMPELLDSMLKGKHEVISNADESLTFP